MKRGCKGEEEIRDHCVISLNPRRVSVFRHVVLIADNDDSAVILVCLQRCDSRTNDDSSQTENE